jgi:hypothetical protein
MKEIKKYEVKLHGLDNESVIVEAQSSYVDPRGVLRFYNDKTVAQFMNWSYYKVV